MIAAMMIRDFVRANERFPAVGADGRVDEVVTKCMPNTSIAVGIRFVAPRTLNATVRTLFRNRGTSLSSYCICEVLVNE